MSDLFHFPNARRRDPAVDEWLATRPPELGALAGVWFQTMRSCGRGVREVMHDHMPTACVGSAAFAYVNVFRSHVNVGFFQGADLDDPKGLLQGTGRRMRHVRVKPGEPIDERALVALIEAAYAEMQRRVTERPSRDARAVSRSAPATSRRNPMNPDIREYNDGLESDFRKICERLAREIGQGLKEAESKVWHAHPVWFLDGNPVVGYSKLKDCVRLLFWSGQSFDEPGLAKEGSFKAAEARFTATKDINVEDLQRWLGKAREIQWAYKNIVKRRGKLVRLK